MWEKVEALKNPSQVTRYDRCYGPTCSILSALEIKNKKKQQQNLTNPQLLQIMSLQSLRADYLECRTPIQRAQLGTNSQSKLSNSDFQNVSEGFIT